MKQLTTNEVQQVSGGWEMGAWSGVGTTLGSYISYVTPHPAVKTFAPVAGMWLGSIYDNIDWDAYADGIRDNIMEQYERGDDISDM
jgi:hypothetical protein